MHQITQKAGLILVLVLTLTLKSFAQVPSWGWARQAGSTGNAEAPAAIAYDALGNSYLTGYFEGAITLDATTLTGSGGRDIFVAKYNPSGLLLWAQKAGGMGFDEAYGLAIDAAGNCVITGQFQSSATFFSNQPGSNITLTATGTTDMFVASYAPSGSLQWASRFGGATGNQVSGQGISADAAGNCYIAGYFSGSGAVVFGPSSLSATSGLNSDAFIAKIDGAGIMLWAKKAGGQGKDVARTIVTDASGNSCMAGTFRATASFGAAALTSAATSTDDVFMARYNTSGDLLWAQKAVSGPSSKTVTGIATDAAGNYYLSGSYKGTALFGNLSFSTLSGQSMFVAKFSNSGNIIWERQSGGGPAVQAAGSNIVADAQGNSYVTGSFSGNPTFSSTISLSSSGLTDIFVTRYSTSGNVLWALKAGGAGADAGKAIAADAGGNYLIAGLFQNTVSFGAASLSGNGGSDIFVAKLGVNNSTVNSIVTGAVSSAVLAPGSTVAVPFTVSGTFISGNTFTAQLSNASGSFANPVTIGSVTGTSSGVITATIPASAANGIAYRIRVVASNPATTGSDNGTNITIASMPVVTAAASTTNLAAGSILTLSVVNPDPTSTYSWTGNSLQSTTGTTVTAQPMVTGTYTYSVTATNIIGSATSQVLVNVICVPPPLATVAPAFICSGSGTATLTASSAGATNYSWFATSTSTVLLQTGSVFTTPVLTASRSYFVLAEAAPGCVGTARKAVSVTVVPDFSISATASDTAILAGAPAVFSASASISGITYSWVGPDLSSASGAVVAATPAQAGTHTYTLYGKRGTCEALNIIELPVTVSGCASGTPSIPTVPAVYICSGGGTAATITASGGGTNVSAYYWYAAANSGVPFHTGATYTTPVLTATASYYVTAVSPDGCESPRRRVNAIIAPDFNVSVASSATGSVLAGVPVQLSASATAPSVTYSWIGPNLNPATGAVVSAAPDSGGTYTYSLVGKIGTCPALNIPTIQLTVSGCLNGTPTIPTVPAIYLCSGGGGTVTFSPTGGGSNVSTFNWYAFANSSVPFHTGLTYTTQALTASNNYYVTAVNSQGCESPKRIASAIVVPDFSISATASAASIQSGVPVSLSASASISGIAYSWTGANLSSAGGAVVVAAPAQTGTYTYTVFGKRGTCEALNTTELVISATDCSSGTPTIPTVPGAFLCSGGGVSATLTASGGGPVASDYKWYSATNVSVPFHTGATFTTPVLSAGKSYYVSAVSAEGCESPRRTVSVVVVPGFTVSATASASSILAGTPVTLSSSATIASVTFSWAGPNVTPATGAVVVAAPAQAGTLTYTLLASRGTCPALNTVEIPVTVSACPGGTPTIPTVPAAFLCSGGGTSATLTASGGGTNIATYNWYAATNAGVPFHTGSSFTTPVLTANKNYFVSAVSTDGCESPRRTASAVVVPDFTISASASSAAVLAGVPVTLSATASIPSVSYTWAGANLSSANGAVVVAAPAQAGNYTYSVSGNRGTCPAQNTANLHVSVTGCAGGTPVAPVVPGVFLCSGGGGTATLTASGGGTNIATYNWYAASNAGTPFHTGASFTTPALTASKTYFVTALSVEGCESPRKAVSAVVVPDFTVSATSSASAAVLAGTPVHLSAAASTTGVTYSWIGANLSAVGGAVVVAAPAQAGSYTYTLYGKRGTCEALNTATVVLSVSGCPGGTPAMPTVPGEFLCGGGGATATLTASGGGTNIATYNWYAATNALLPFHTGTSFTTPVLTANKSYYVSAVSVEGCESPRRAVSVIVVPDFTIAATSSASGPVLAGNPVQLSATATITGVSYSWTGPGLSSSSGASVVAAPATAGTYTYTLTGKRGTCFAQNTVLIPVTVTGCPGGAPTIPTVPGVSLCNGGGTSVPLTASGGGTNVMTYIWYAASNTATAFYTGATYTTPVLTTSVSYFVSAVTAQGCESPRRRVNVIVAPDFTVSATASPATVAPGAPITLSATATAPSVTYSWIGPNLSAASGATVVATPPQAGNYTYTVFGKIGTCTSAPATVQVSVFFAGGSGPQGDGSVQDPEGIAKLAAKGTNREDGKLQMKVYPNPFISDLFVLIEEPSEEQAQILIRDLTGRVVYRQTAVLANPGQPLILQAGKELAQGVYLLQVIQGKKDSVARIVKQ